MVLGAPTTIISSGGSPRSYGAVRSSDCVVENMNVGEGAKLDNNVQKRHGGIPVTSEDCVGDNLKYDNEECRASSTPSSMSNLKLQVEKPTSVNSRNTETSNDCVGQEIMNVNDDLKFGKEESVDNDRVENNLKYGIEEQNTTSSPSVDKETLRECVFKRGGLCKIHGIVGQKDTRSGKKWGAKKNGIFGWVTSKSTVYICKMGQSPENCQFFYKPDPEILNLPTLSWTQRQNEGTVLSYFAKLKAE